MEEYRKCPICGYKNDVIVLECENPDYCGADLSEVSPTMDSEEALLQPDESGNAPVEPEAEGNRGRATVVMELHQLVSVNDSISISIPFSGGVLGREGDFETAFFDKSKYASRRHAEIGYQGVQLYIKDLNSQNGTYVNNVRVKPDEVKYLEAGDKVVLADIEFHVQR